ncbi:hypothetical protein SCHPADRAFT_381499 [Schizopora paradoxa]|uniref:Uncharacterized protein n=1 Tax=Schizopora paradoxa TaxID=27342 RepID=A0A0H2S883_9AGAM|nr:hypothetical protein SCHPADRAFT_381499 [Schizopora paradoxa]
MCTGTRRFRLARVILSIVQPLCLVITSSAPRAACSSSTLTNVSIDDSSPDPFTGTRISYGSIGNITDGAGWNIGQNCSICLAQPDPSQVFDGTWHDTSTWFAVKGPNAVNKPFASVSFTGVAVFVVGIIVLSTPATSSPLNNTRMFFQVDGAKEESFSNDASLGDEVIYSYNVTLFSKTGLENGLHNITMICGDGRSSADSLCLLDEIIYTTVELMASDSDSSSSNSSSTSNTSSLSNDIESATALTGPQPSISTPSNDLSAPVSITTVAATSVGSTLFIALLVGFYFARRLRKRSQDFSLNDNRKSQRSIPVRTTYSGHSEHAVGTLSDHDMVTNHGLPSYTDIASDMATVATTGEDKSAHSESKISEKNFIEYARWY